MINEEINNSVPIENTIGKITNKASVEKKRVWEIDFLRALCIFLVVLDHTLCDVWMVNVTISPYTTGFGKAMYKFAMYYWTCGWRAVIQPFIVNFFLILSGISCSLSHSNAKRSIKMLGFAGLITVSTYWIDYIAKSLIGSKLGIEITFNIIHVIAISVAIWALVELIEKYLKRIPNLGIFIFAVLLILVGEYMKLIYNGYDDISLLNPAKINGIASWVFWNSKVNSADFLPLLPSLGYFLMGAVIGRVHYKDKKTLFPDVNIEKFRFVTFCGRHTLWIYIGGQVVAFAFVALLAIIIK